MKVHNSTPFLIQNLSLKCHIIPAHVAIFSIFCIKAAWAHSWKGILKAYYLTLNCISDTDFPFRWVSTPVLITPLHGPLFLGKIINLIARSCSPHHGFLNWSDEHELAFDDDYGMVHLIAMHAFVWCPFFASSLTRKCLW